MQIKAIRGARDILPGDLEPWRVIEETAKGLCETYGYQEIRTPLLEEARLFSRSIGASSDIVRKEMYSFADRKQRLLCLRPEATASVVRAYLEHNLDKNLSLAKFYYLGPMFRAERPQAGRLRQFHHIGVEAIGSSSPYLDAEVIALAMQILNRLQISNAALELNSLGCRKDRQKYKLALRAALKNKLKLLCPDCHKRQKTNLLRIFDCKNQACKKVTGGLAAIKEFLCPECSRHFLRLKEILDSLNIAYRLNAHLVRGLDYYTSTCFEIVHPDLGAQNALGAGGRYDDLVSDLGGPQKAAVGFALGIERIINVLDVQKIKTTKKTPLSAYIAFVGENAKEKAFSLIQHLRDKDISSEMDYQDRSLKAQMRMADKLGAKYAAILGEEELAKGAITLRNMQSKEQKAVGFDNLAEELQ